MCGIAAALGAPESVPRMVRLLAHRGPDQRGWRQDGDLAVGACRLRVVGGATGDMPLVSPSGRTVVVVNGEIFNHRELFPGRDGASDLEGLPGLLEREGPAALRRLRGPFALAAADLEQRTLLLARDEIGIRPLFVAETGAHVAAASEPGPLMEGTPRPDHAAWDHLLAFQFWPRDRSPWAGVRPLPPGRWRRYRMRRGSLVVDEGGLAFDGGEEDLEGALAAAFRLQSPSSPRSGVTLSGGLDSSAVLGGLALAGHAPAVAATGFFPEAPPGYDERPWARRAASAWDVPCLEVPVTAAAYLDAWPRLIRALGGPLAGPGGPAQWIVCRALAEAGAGVVFGGQGGDELFGGYERHRLLLQRDLGRPLSPASGYETLLPVGAPDPAQALLFRGAALLPWLEPRRRKGVLAAAASLPDARPPLADRLLEWECRTLLPGLLAVDDRTTAAFGMEGRVPLLDPVVARLARAIPLATKSPPERPRHLFRSLLGDLLPPFVRARRDKMGFPVPVDLWLEGPWREVVFDHPGLDLLPEVGFLPGIRDALRDGRVRGRAAWFVLSAALSLHHANDQAGVPARPA